MSRDAQYRIAIGLILAGVAMMCQPFAVALYSAGFPVILAGVVMFVWLDHRAAPPEDN